MQAYKNPRKNKIIKSIWFEDEKEFKKLINAIAGNFNDEVLDIVHKIYERGDFND